MSAQVVIDFIENEDKKSCTIAEFYLVGKLSARGFWHSKTRPGGAAKGPKRGWKHGMRLILSGEGSIVHVDQPAPEFIDQFIGYRYRYQVLVGLPNGK